MKTHRGPVVYEVVIELKDSRIRDSYLRWMDEHIQEMLTIPGFQRADLLTDLESSGKRLRVQYVVKNRRFLERYFDNEAAEMRQDGVTRFGQKFQAKRHIYSEKKYTGLAARQSKRSRGQKIMDFKLDKILNEVAKIGNVAKLKSEINRVQKEFTALKKMGTEQAKQTIKQVEKKYAQIVGQFNNVQKQFDQELGKAMKTIEKTKGDVEKTITGYKKKAQEQKQTLSKKLGKKKSATKKKATKKKATKKAATKKTSAKAATKKTTKKTAAKKAPAKKKTTKKAAAKKTRKKN